MAAMPTGMVREVKIGKPEFLKYLDPRVLRRYGEHMRRGAERGGFAPDNFKLGGYPRLEYLESLFRHLMVVWEQELGLTPPTEEDHAAAIMFNITGYMLEQEREKTSEGAA